MKNGPAPQIRPTTETWTSNTSNWNKNTSTGLVTAGGSTSAVLAAPTFSAGDIYTVTVQTRTAVRVRHHSNLRTSPSPAPRFSAASACSFSCAVGAEVISRRRPSLSLPPKRRVRGNRNTETSLTTPPFHATHQFQISPHTLRDRHAGAAFSETTNSLEIGSWTTVSVPDTTSTMDDVDFTVTGTGPLKVTATIPAGKAADGKLFGRLKTTE